MQTASFRNKRRRKPGDLSAMRRTLWAGLLTAEELCDSPDPQVRLRALHALATLAGVYLRTVESADLEARITELERAISQQRERGDHVRAVG
jgi:predicted ATP-grasp superfamily ATP-dependent carboligase